MDTVTVKRKMKATTLSPHEEQDILDELMEKLRNGESVHRKDVINRVIKFITSDNRKNPFRNNVPGDKWFSLFRRRHNRQFLELEPVHLEALEQIGFTEKVKNTVIYQFNACVKKKERTNINTDDVTQVKKRKPKELKSSTPIKSTSPPRDLNSSAEIGHLSDVSYNMNTDDSDRSGQENQSDPTSFQPGIKLEVMDFNDDKWYPVRVVEVDYDEGEVLVHFEKWSNLYDEWVRMDSNRIRRPQLPSNNASRKIFVENEKVIAVWAYNHKYPATVRKVLPNDKYEVLFSDGYAKILRGCKLFKATEEDLKNIKLPPPKKPAPPMGADPLDPNLGPKEERRLKKRRLDVYQALLPQKKHRSDHPDDLSQTSPTDYTSESLNHSSLQSTPTSAASTSFKLKEMPKVVFRGRGRQRRVESERGKVKSEDSQEEDDGWIEDSEDSDQAPSAESTEKKRRKVKKKMAGTYSNCRYKSTDDDAERWNMEIPEGVQPVQIMDTEGHCRESIIIPDKNLLPGWTKHTMIRKKGAKWDVFLVNEEGRKFRSRNELRNYFADLKIPFPEENFDFTVGRKMERIRSQTDLRRKLSDSPGAPMKGSPIHKKGDGKDSKDDSTPDTRKIRTLLPKSRTVDSGDEMRRDRGPKTTAETPAFPIAELRTPDGGYTCCGKTFRKENLFQMHMKHYHPEYSNLFGSTPNVADLAYARTVGEPLEDSRAEAMTPKNTLLERVNRYEADRQRKAAASTTEEKSREIIVGANLRAKSEEKEPTPVEHPPVQKPTVEETHTPVSVEVKKEDETTPGDQNQIEPVEKEEEKDEDKSDTEEVDDKETKSPIEITPPPTVEEKVVTPDEKPEETAAKTTDIEELPPEKPPPSTSPHLQAATLSPAPHSKPIIKSVSKVRSEAVIVQTTTSPKIPVTITKYVPPGQNKPTSESKIKVTISGDKETKTTIKTLLPLRPPVPARTPTPEPKVTPEPPTPKENKLKEEPEEDIVTPPKSKPRKRTVSEPLLKKPKLSKVTTGSLEEDASEAAEATGPGSTVTTATGSTAATAAAGSGFSHRFSRNRSQVPQVALEKLNISTDSNGRVTFPSDNEKPDKIPINEGRRPVKKFKSANNISKKPKGVEAKTDTLEEIQTASSDAVYENLRKEEIINCTCGFTEEDGLMIQCDLCLCWQHGYCNNINKESEVPEKYVCYICQNPARQRESLKYRHNQEWLKEGKLPSFSFREKDEEGIGQRERMLKKSHELSASVLQLESVIHSLQVKTHIATMKQDHPKLYLWAKSWKDSSSEIKNENEQDKNKKEILGPQPEAAIDSKECRLKLLEHIEDYQNQVEDRLTSIDAQIAELESEDPDQANDEAFDSRLKQTVQMLLRDLTTLQRVAALN